MSRYGVVPESAQRAVHAVLAILVAGVVIQQSDADTMYGLLGLVALAFCIADLTQLTLPRGREISLSGGVATVAATMLYPLAGVGALAVGALAAAAVRDHVPKPYDTFLQLLRRVVALMSAYWVFSATSVLIVQASVTGDYAVMSTLAAGLTYMVVDVLSFAAIDAARSGRSVLRSTTSLFGLVGGVYLSQVFVGAAATIVYASLQAIGFVILFVLMLLLQSSFALLLRVRAAYTRTLSALARLAECEAGGTPGHSERVAELATTIARVRHMSGHEAKVLSYAALLHNIGDVSCSDEARDGADAPSLEDLFDDIPYLTGVGAVISKSLIPFEVLEAPLGRADALGGVLRVACAYDAMLAGSDGPGADIIDALEGPGYDPTAVRALETALARQEV